MPVHLKSAIRNPKSTIVLLLICTVAFALRLGPLWDNRFHPDEALFSTWALKIARGENLLLTGVPVDKPPLLIYLTALSFFVFGQSELAARVPDLLASVITVPLLYQLTRRYWPSRRLIELPALLLALSPFAILFAPTAFLDPAMVMFGLASLVAASRGRAGWAGVLLGLSFATKVQGLFFAPLVPVFWSRSQIVVSSSRSTRLLRGHLVIWSHPIGALRSRDASQSSCHSIWRFVLGFTAVALLVVAWDRTRGGLPFWVQQTINYGGIRLIFASELAPRFTGWLSFLPYFFGPLVGLIGLIGLPLLLYRDVARDARRAIRDARTRAAWIDLWLLAYAIGFFALYWLLAFPVWDRYLLMLVPITALLIARSIHLVTKISRLSISPSFLLSLIIIAILPFSLAAAESQYPIGGDHGANDGIDQVANYLKSLPSGTVVYDHWLAWELGYYLGDGFAYLAYFDTPAALTDDLRVFAAGGDDRYVIFPAGEAPDKVIDSIGQVGYTLTPVLETKNRFDETSFTVYRIVKPAY